MSIHNFGAVREVNPNKFSLEILFQLHTLILTSINYHIQNIDLYLHISSIFILTKVTGDAQKISKYSNLDQFVKIIPQSMLKINRLSAQPGPILYQFQSL